MKRARDWSEAQERAAYLMRTRRASHGLSLRQAATVVGVSSSTLWRLEHHVGGGGIAAKTLSRLAEWGAAPLDVNAVMVEDADTLTGICNAIRSDTLLHPEAAESLCRLMTIAYTEVITALAAARCMTDVSTANVQ